MFPCCSSLSLHTMLRRFVCCLRIVGPDKNILQCELWDCRNQISRWPQLSFCWLSCMRPIWCLLVLTTAGRQNTAQSGPRILIGKIGAAAGTWAPRPQTILVPQIDPSVSQPVFTIMEKAPTRAFSWLKVPTSAFTLKTLLRHYAKRALTPR